MNGTDSGDQVREYLHHLHEGVHLAEFIVNSLTNLETHMSDLTDKVDAALALLQTESAGVEALVAANSAASDVIKGQLAAAQAGQAADEAELQKAIDALAAVNASLQTNPPPVPVTPPVPTGTGTPPAPTPAP